MLISKIDDTNDEQILKAIYTLLDGSPSSETFIVSEDHQQSIYQPKKDIALGNYILNDDLHQEILKWLSK